VQTNNDAPPGEGDSSPTKQQESEVHTFPNGKCVPVIHTDKPTIVSKLSTMFAKPGEESMGRRIQSITDLNVGYGKVINGHFDTATFVKCDFNDAHFTADCSFETADLSKVKDLSRAILPEGWYEVLLEAGLVEEWDVSDDW